MKIHVLLLLCFCLSSLSLKAQSVSGKRIPDFATGVNDTLKVMTLNDIYIYPPQAFRNSADEEKYRKLIRDVKKTLPFAKMIYATLIETYEYIMTLPTEKEREAHLKRMEKELYTEYMPVLKKMTLSQGKLLIKLIDRECNQSSYDLLKAFLGSFRAGFWNFFCRHVRSQPQIDLGTQRKRCRYGANCGVGGNGSDLKISQITIPAATETFSECLVPYCGISMQESQLKNR